ncbi:MAG: hypothetical protein LC790_22370 [Actinobacteria bacterium]|nr:hypothetical protein [Actinomycetota bacterium]
MALADDRADHALRDLLDAARRVDEQLCGGAFALTPSERERLRALLADVRQRGERAIDASVQRRLARLRGRRGWRSGRDRGARIQTPWGSSCRGAGTARCLRGRSTLTTPPARRTKSASWG